MPLQCFDDQQNRGQRSARYGRAKLQETLFKIVVKCEILKKWILNQIK